MFAPPPFRLANPTVFRSWQKLVIAHKVGSHIRMFKMNWFEQIWSDLKCFEVNWRAERPKRRHSMPLKQPSVRWVGDRAWRLYQAPAWWTLFDPLFVERGLCSSGCVGRGESQRGIQGIKIPPMGKVVENGDVNLVPHSAPGQPFSCQSFHIG